MSTVLKTKAIYPPASEASREVENFDWKKNPHSPVYCVKNLSVCLSVTNFDPNYLRTGRIEWAENKIGTYSLCIQP